MPAGSAGRGCVPRDGSWADDAGRDDSLDDRDGTLQGVERGEVARGELEKVREPAEPRSRDGAAACC